MGCPAHLDSATRELAREVITGLLHPTHCTCGRPECSAADKARLEESFSLGGSPGAENNCTADQLRHLTQTVWTCQGRIARPRTSRIAVNLSVSPTR
jgi:hypothetical protein